MAAFVVTMWKVYEDFVTTALIEALRGAPGRLRPQLPAYLAGEGDWTVGEIPMSVDLVHCDVRGRPRVVLDAKYKAPAPSGSFANADHYQMLAYCTALAVPRAWLVYAGGQGQRVRVVKNSGVEIVEWPLDLSRSPRDVLAQIDDLARVAVPQRRERLGLSVAREMLDPDDDQKGYG